MHTRSAICLAGFILGLIAPFCGINAQTPAAPQSYSFVHDPALALTGSMVVKVSRDGPMELVDQTSVASPGQPNGFHARSLYDFQEHRIYTQVLSDAAVPCSVMRYTPPEAPLEFDLISGAKEFMQQLNARSGKHPKHVGDGTVNEIAAKIYEVPGAPPDKGKSRVWLSAQGRYPLKWVYIAPDGRQQTLIEVKHLNFAHPPASDFARPEACVPLQGDASSSGAYEQLSPVTPGSAGSLATPAGVTSSKYIDAVYPPEAPTTDSCQVSFKVVRAGAMEPVTSGFKLGILTSADFSGGRYMVDVTDQLHDGLFRIEKPPQHFYLDVKIGGMNATALIYTRCLAPHMDLLLVLKGSTNDPDHWYWVNPVKR
jgi:hypothetical protein